MNFKKWVKSIQTAGYNGARMVTWLVTALSTYYFKPELSDFKAKKVYLKVR